MADESDSSNSIPRQTPAGVDTPDVDASDDSDSDTDATGRTDGSGYAQSRRVTGGSSTIPGDHYSTPDSIKHSPFLNQDEALDSLRETEEIEDPVERLKEYANGKAAQALLELREPPEAAVSVIQRAQDRVFQDIRATAEDKPIPEGIVYLEDVLFEFDLADDRRVDVEGVIEKVERKVRKLKGHLEQKRERQPEHSVTPFTDEGSESTRDRWRHLARAKAILERHSELDSFGEFHEKALEMGQELGMEEYENPGEAIKKGVQRLRRDLTDEDEDGTPPRYHGMKGFESLVDDLIQGRDVTLRGRLHE